MHLKQGSTKTNTLNLATPKEWQGSAMQKTQALMIKRVV